MIIMDIVELVQKFDAFCFQYQHVDCLCTLIKDLISGKIIARSGQVTDNAEKAVYFNQKIGE